MVLRAIREKAAQAAPSRQPEQPSVEASAVDQVQQMGEFTARKAVYMLFLVNEVVASGDDMEAHEDEFRHISEETEQLKRRVQAIHETMNKDASYQDKLKEIQAAIEHREENADTYDDSIVRQMIECIKVFPDRRLELCFGGGYRMEEYVQE